MRVAIYGAGAMGTVLGAFITKAGYEVDLINRNKDHVRGLQEHGAQIQGTLSMSQDVTALLPEEMTGLYDVILLMTKQRHNQEIVTFLQPYLAQDGVLCTLQNGIPEPLIASIIGDERTIGATMSWGATFIGGGVVELTTEPSRETLTFSIGSYSDKRPQHFDYVVTLLHTMGHVTIEDNFIGARWSKLLINAAYSGLSVVTGATFGELNKNRTTRTIALGAMKECIDVAKASNLMIEPLQGKDVVKLMDYNNPFKKQFSLFLLPIAMRKHKNIKSSMLRDLARGYTTEIDAINGVVCDAGDQVGIETPINDLIVSIVHEIETNKRASSWDNIKDFDMMNMKGA
ncbi:ketopantoate reductase family protein [Candidatus Xianfuyuplasma coldseepsis]|uniref:2-dehydropantoate 2-reductase n=1 Tax=Candidatus Xianfuyuplasma coldseepsis TaxID=2782163 RepID=A0A7L7KR11_9MOLU|nr:ketopantoate reductase family protein [Xianfuyuplasma coldseepsis]QMS84656.1 ketopantoate reductase family protein [Xianfuyuplasma coldseepsis]